ncbi:hypothetical protein KI688_001290 [Linnemannia hyalina]|uniref:Uncharacterized protein n=1 Tax=Linnemannia hyalina TaxID=64524 RepID=A0A9P8BSI3_9FUNG|nr:hypothetical protein KI688_001290 [Linnemannia hyalina]
MAPPSRGAGESGVASPAAAHLSDSGTSSRGVPLASTHYFDPRPNYGPISAHSNNSTSSGATTAATSNKDKKKKHNKIQSSIYHQMGIGGLTQTPRSLPYSDYLLPYSNRPTAPLSRAATGAAIGASPDQGQGWSTAGPLPPPSTSSSTFPSFHLRKSQSVGKSNGTKKGIKSPFKKLRRKQGSNSSTSRDPHHALAFITSASGESDSEAGNDNEQETTFNARGMMSRFGTGMSDNTNNSSSSTTTKSKPRHAAALFDAGLPHHPFRNLSFNYNHNSGGSRSNKGGGAVGVENGGSGEGQQQQQHKEPSAARFKDFFKNVGSYHGHHHSHSQSMSAAGSPTMHPASSPSPPWDHYYPSVGGAGGAPVTGLMKSFQTRGTLPRLDFLSGDDQPSSTPRFRIPGPGRRKKRFSKKFSSTGGYAPAATDDEDSPAHVRSATTMFSGSGGRQRNHTHQDDVGPRRQQNHHQHHRFLPNFHYRQRSRSFDEGSSRDVEITWRLPATPVRSEEGRSNISPALREAQRKNPDPGVLLVELEPLPTRIVHDLAAIKSRHHQHHHQHNGSQSLSSGSPLNNFMVPSSTNASGFGSATSGPTATHNNSQNSSFYNPQMMTPLLQLQLQEQQQQKQQHNEQPLIRPKADPAAIFCTKSFLFKSYQSSRFRGHYVFRVVGDQLEYRRLPNALEESCSQYFRTADVTYRSLERKAKAIREERDKRKRNTLRSQSQPQLLHHRQQQLQLQHQNSLPLSAKLTRTKSQDRDEFYGTSTSDRSVATLSSFLKEGGGLSQGDSGGFLGGGSYANKRRSFGDDVLRSAVPWDYYNPSFSSIASTPMPTEVLSDSSISNSTIFTGRSSRSSRGGGNSSYANQRYNAVDSNNALVRTFLGRSRTGTDRILKSDPLVVMNPYAAAAGIVSFQSPKSAAAIARPPLSRNKTRSWSSIKEEQRRQEEEEENRLMESERKFREELEQAIYGLELYLAEILRGLEYERFDAVADVQVVDENRDTAIFTLYNGDRTNIMSLESPSTKLKYEFINRIAISLMGHEEAEHDAFWETEPKDTGRHHLNSFLHMSTGTLRDRSEDTTEDADLLFDMIDIRLQQQEAKLRSMRENIQSTMNEIDSCLSQLDHLDERAKKMMTTMITAIDSHEIQLSLRPSPSTGLTLAETVEAKLRDVNERIVICTRIMGAARQNLNRLKYEIELEQRSIRLFRQYKIIIAVISGSIVFLVWFLYHARASALAPQPASPLFSTPPNPFEEIYNFHHGEPPILPSPASTLGFTSSKIVVAPSASTPTPFPHPSAFSSVERDGGESTAVDSGARMGSEGSGQKSCFQADDETGRNSNSKNESPFDFLEQGHLLADLDLQDEFDATTAILDHNEL